MTENTARDIVKGLSRFTVQDFVKENLYEVLIVASDAMASLEYDRYGTEEEQGILDKTKLLIEIFQKYDLEMLKEKTGTKINIYDAI